MPRGYDRALYIQPFGHCGSFQSKMFGWGTRELPDGVAVDHHALTEG